MLPNGKVLLASGPYELKETEIYDPSTNTWNPAGTLTTPRQYTAMTLLPNGKVLLAGGYHGGRINSCEIFDPGLSVQPNAAPIIASASDPLRLNDRLILSGSLFTGISEASSGGTNGSPSNNPVVQLRSLANDQTLTLVPESWTANQYTSKSNTSLPLGPASITVTVNGITSVAKQIQVSLPQTQINIGTLSPATASTGQLVTIPFTVTSATPGTMTGNVTISDGFNSTTVAVGAGTATLAFFNAGQRTIILTYGGDSNYSGSTASTQYQVTSAMPGFTNVAPMNAIREAHTATLLPSGKVLIAAGYDATLLASAEMYDPATNTWSLAANLQTARYRHTATLMSNGRVLVAGGLGSLNGAEIFDPAANVWSTTGSLSSPRFDHTSTLLPNGKVLVAGGNDGSNTMAGAEIYNPIAQTWSAAGTMLAPRANHAAVLLSNGKVFVCDQDLATGQNCHRMVGPD